ncbi:family 47 glycosyl hydrolase [Rhizodiscina lignyota]|uniref:alpha-1,2-Mannosidase n=1 Tax=Rhizodiscina lignyota TaxID=1504668 RepID=A0A9P4M6S7_9PEZI|nr:family 47 glycosyl hydrolase [Rhizodiscina lignyota]
MNNLNRDPFNLRRSAAGPSPALSPLQSLLQNSAARAVDISRDFSRQVAEQGKQALEQGKQALEQGMSFSMPRNVPNFQDPARGYEDRAWSGSGSSRFPSVSIGGHGAASSKGLPMYKDKPYNYAASGRRPGWFRKRRLLALVGLVILGWVWWQGALFGARSPAEKGFEAAWKFWGKGTGGSGGDVDWLERRERVKDAFKLSWAAYEQYAWGYDEYKPISKVGRQMVPPNGFGWIIVDSLDTMMLMNLTTELAHAREWISTSLSYDVDHDVNTFETTIRMLGGLLAAHYLSTEFPDMAPVPTSGKKNEDLYLEKATDLADRLLGAYESGSGVPWASVNLKTMKGIQSHTDGGASSTAEATSLQLEMKYLAQLTGETVYWHKAEKVMQVVDDNGRRDGLLPIFINADRGEFRGENIRLGSRGDSYYEYLIKQYLQTEGKEPIYLQMWNQAMTGIRKHLLTYSSPSDFLVLAERPSGLDQAMEPKMDHLACFMPGTIALGVTGGDTVARAQKDRKWLQKDDEEMHIAKELMKTCWGMYRATATGLAPEIAYFNIHDPPLMYEDPAAAELEIRDPEASWKQDYIIKPADTHNLQRPETVESLFYMWRITGDEMYRHWGWEMFQSFVNYTAVGDGAGFSSIRDVTKTSEEGHGWRDNMESFWLAETLKYFYLLFSPDDLLPLNKVVFNTEAHPLPRFDMGRKFTTGWQRKPRDPDGNLLKVPKQDEPQKMVPLKRPDPWEVTPVEKSKDSSETTDKNTEKDEA